VPCATPCGAQGTAPIGLQRYRQRPLAHSVLRAATAAMKSSTNGSTVMKV
jgi:hypothetical protein